MIATLCVTNLTMGIGNLITNGTAIYDLPDEFLVLGRGYIGPIPVQVVIMAVITVISGIVLSSTTYGRYIYAIGGNPKVAKLSGVNVSKLKVIYFMVGGALSALAGVLITSRMGTAQPTLGTNWPMETIAGIVIGGTHFQGGSGSIVNSVLGVLLMTMITNGLNLLGVNTFWQSVVTARFFKMQLESSLSGFSPDHLDKELISQATLVHIAGSMLAWPDSLEAIRQAIDFVHEEGKLVSCDVNWREMLYDQEYAQTIAKPILYEMDILKMSEEEMSLYTGTSDLVEGTKICCSLCLCIQNTRKIRRLRK